MYPEVIGAIDVTPIFIQRPTDQETQRSVYSGKYKRHCMKIQCLVVQTGFVFTMQEHIEEQSMTAKYSAT